VGKRRARDLTAPGRDDLVDEELVDGGRAVAAPILNFAGAES